MRSVNLVGFVGNDPRSSDKGKVPVAYFSICAKHAKDDDMWFNITCFGRLAEFVVEYMKQGRLVSVTGSIKGISVYKDVPNIDVTAQEIQFINSGDSEGKGNSGKKDWKPKNNSGSSDEKSKWQPKNSGKSSGNKPPKKDPEPEDDGNGEAGSDWED